MNLTRCVFLCVCGFIAVVALGLQWDRESLEARVAQCNLNKAFCEQNRYQATTCQQHYAQCLQKLANDRHDSFVVGVGCCIFITISSIFHCCAKYDRFLQLAAILSFQLYRAHQWGDNPVILAIEVLILACKQWLGQASSIAPLGQCFCIVFMIFWTDYGSRYMNRQTWRCQAEVVIGLAWLAYDAFKIWLRPRPVRDPPAAPAEQRRETAPTKPPFELLTPSVEMYQVCGVWFTSVEMYQVCGVWVNKQYS
jgi:hypothetical protein